MTTMMTKMTVQSSTTSGCFSSPSDPTGESTNVEPFASFQNTTRLVMTMTIFWRGWRIITLYHGHWHKLSHPGSWCLGISTTHMLYGDILDHLMKQSSTKAFPNGLIPSPFARQVKIFTHWISDWCGDLLMIGACLQVCLFNISMLNADDEYGNFW